MFTVIIPARFGSTRLPGKPLAEINGKTMIQRVYERAVQSRAERVVVATDDSRVEEAVKAFGGECCMTRADHESGTDRLQEVCDKLGLAEDAIVVNVQGDEPLIPPAVINQVADNLHQSSGFSAATLCEAITRPQDKFNPNIVKVVASGKGRALYFSRAPVPWSRDRYQVGQLAPSELAPGSLRHIGIYAYRVKLLNAFTQWEMSPLEAIEKLEQLRILHNGEDIHVALACEEVPGGVDTAEDLTRIAEYIRMKEL